MSRVADADSSWPGSRRATARVVAAGGNALGAAVLMYSQHERRQLRTIRYTPSLQSGNRLAWSPAALLEADVDVHSDGEQRRQHQRRPAKQRADGHDQLWTYRTFLRLACDAVTAQVLLVNFNLGDYCYQRLEGYPLVPGTEPGWAT